MIFGSSFTVVYDACVLVPNVLRDALVSLTGTEMFRAKWTQRIHDEWIGTVLRIHPDIERKRPDRVSQLMNEAVRDGLVEGWEDLEAAVKHQRPDPDDAHVVAAAIRCDADVIVTKNLKDFPDEVLKRFRVETQHPDDFIRHLIDLDPLNLCLELRKQRQRWREPTATVTEFLDALERQELPLTVDALRGICEFL